MRRFVQFLENNTSTLRPFFTKKILSKSGKIIVDVKVVSSKIAQIAKKYLGCFCNKIYYQEVKKSLKMVTLLPTKMNSSKCKIKGPILQRNFHT